MSVRQSLLFKSKVEAVKKSQLISWKLILSDKIKFAEFVCSILIATNCIRIYGKMVSNVATVVTVLTVIYIEFIGSVGIDITPVT